MSSKKTSYFKGFKGFLLGIGCSLVLLFFVQAKNSDSYFEVSKNLDIFATLVKELNSYYVDPVEPGKLVKTGVDAMLNELDPYTNYYTESAKEEFEFQTKGKYGGIGASMRLKGEDIYVGDVYENSPAQKAGLHPGDILISIDGKSLKGKNIDDLSLLLKGSPGTQLNIRIKDAFTGEESQKILTRGEIELSSVPFYGLAGKDKNVAFVKLTQFTPGCSRMVRIALDSLKTQQPNLKSVILDLRNNPGGLLDEAVNVCNLFIDKGQLVVSTKGKLEEMDKEYKTHYDPWDTKIPVAVLINHSSASASEIVSGTIQDLDRGIVIGELSYGKGLVQTTRNLGYNAMLKLTTARYYTPSGRCIQAIDYAHRNGDGSASKVPDSLKKLFKTKVGRKVLSGGGIEPDVKVIDEPKSKLATTLYAKNYLFDYTTIYVKQHNSIPNAGEFGLTETDFNAFVKWLDDKDYAYKTETEIALDSVKQAAIREKYFDGMKSSFTALQNAVSHDKKQDLIKNKKEITELLESEIVSRYYFLRGRIENSLKHDADLDKALELLANTSQYTLLLKPN